MPINDNTFDTSVFGTFDEVDTWAAGLPSYITTTYWADAYTVYSESLPFTVETGGRLANPNYGGWEDRPGFLIALAPNNPATLFSQLDSLITAAYPGAEDSVVLGGHCPAIYVDVGDFDTDYYAAPSVSGAPQANARLRFLYEVTVDGESGPKLGVTDKFYHSNVAVTHSGTPVTVNRRVGVFAAFYSGEIRFADFLSGYSPSEPWEPTSGIGCGLPEIQIYNTDTFPSTPVLLYSGTDWRAVLLGLTVPQPG